ncbi:MULTISPECIES: phage shock protein PspA [Idiomarina]|jgi:phage shock protein A|uniref:Phage shock protein PspA n=2 Tax=Idiomarina baltica TaxID=190892 RepID=A0A348WQF0_9GAMM|nr:MULTISPECIES: phage shock protein PspA [Idiomarina]MAF75108.1 phage shock protein PspA [Idiomarinaceae bacterium]MEC8925812.1 phage shock protein PspA [Pseudomonadota bacterium]EAQ32040.1 Phage shock protein A [Idiomarina baltica OS145]KXS35748.1 MAG: phage shock protein A [Idiomarina sp. T82-3]MBL73527.1 phage shock protein PspA [Idiomarinaceae bacterium]|tara:strand:- start:257 stop:934 length:678 start_codon:yes stop_codon:yes gene_type:complete
MGIFSRFSDIVNSNINSLLDKAEDPQKMVRLIIQEMEDTLVEVRSTSARLIAEKKDVQRQQQRVEHEVLDWENKAELALSKEREDLAKQALIEKQKAQQAVDSLQQELERVDESLSKLNDEISQLQEKLADAKARQKTIMMREKTASSRLQVRKQVDSGKVDEAMMKFDRYEAKIDDIEAQVDAYDMGKRTLRDEFAELENESKVTDELEALKARMNAKKNENSQ